MWLLPRRRRAEAKAWTYVALFGAPDDEDGDDMIGDGDAAADPEPADGTRR